jgi:hypothetical protein
MRNFHCDTCDNLVFFENSECLECGRKLGFLPDLGLMTSLEPAGNDVWSSPATKAGARTYRLCKNYSLNNICNWTVAVDDPNPLCLSCRLTRTIPNLSLPANRTRWHRLEIAKRRLLYTFLCLGLPITGKAKTHDVGMTFDFLADPDPASAAPALTGHADGVITVNIAEADDVEREKRRTQMHEPYRTILGHFRHESGHYYWDLLLRDTPRLDELREVFGDERRDYADALRQYYQNGAAADWQLRFVSAYASSHPWEDWAETWAHYLHMTDTLETAMASGMALRPKRSDEPGLVPNLEMIGCQPESFDEMITRWFPLTFALNNLNRGMGLPDGYPFVLSAPVIEKLRLIHNIIASKR